MSGFAREEGEGVTRGARALVVLPQLREDPNRSGEARLDEAVGLAAAIGVEIVGRRVIRVREPRAATLMGKGQVESLANDVAAHEAQLVVVDAGITAVQQKNLEDALKAKVIDRTGLILEIFGERAATSEGRMQVELAHLDYQAGRLVRSWTHLERQRGGFGFLGGPGETQIEADRRLIRDRMAKIRRELEQVKRTRQLHRDRRKKAPWPVIALVGYTNAGKSTLFNRLTKADVLAEDLLFATLDPTMRDMTLPGFAKAILSDTVGFVSNLPTELVAAFRATLEEVVSADLIVHVRDIAHPDSDAQAADVAGVLTSIGASGADAPPMIEAWNKVDLVDAETNAALRTEAARREDVVVLSAETGEGEAELLRMLTGRLQSGGRIHRLSVPTVQGARLAWLHNHGEVLDTEVGEEETLVTVRLDNAHYHRFQAQAV